MCLKDDEPGKTLRDALSSKPDKYISLALVAFELSMTAHMYGIGPESPRYEREKELLMVLWALSTELRGDDMKLFKSKLYSAVPVSGKNAPEHFNGQTSRWMDPMIEEERKKLERWGQEQKKRWAEDPWMFTRSAITTLLHAADAMVRQPKQRDSWFEQMLVEVTDPLRAWWAKLKEDYDRNPHHKPERSESPDDALRYFYLECKTSLVDPAKADEARARWKALMEKIKPGFSDPNGYIGTVPYPVRTEKRTETPEELVELAINHVTEACRKYWAQAKAKGNT